MDQETPARRPSVAINTRPDLSTRKKNLSSKGFYSFSKPQSEKKTKRLTITWALLKATMMPIKPVRALGTVSKGWLRDWRKLEEESRAYRPQHC